MTHAYRTIDLQPAPAQPANTDHAAHVAGRTWHIGIKAEEYSPLAGAYQAIDAAHFAPGQRPRLTIAHLTRHQDREIGTGTGPAIELAHYEVHRGSRKLGTITPDDHGCWWQAEGQPAHRAPTLTEAIAQILAARLLQPA